ncbi:conjugal transfer protein TraG N-terminal domain-containing protein, partial [Pectobacterium versatile]|uniref:conjugal transfer protein TraG N-terminal domain-containing protein n=1 Tax=Pectobacterium versatile TaxID=2488639 RepID=UPI001F1A88B8
MKTPKIIILLFSIFPFHALAYDSEYVINGGFQTIVNAFTRIKFIFNDAQFATLLVGMVAIGMVVAAMQRIGKAVIDFSDSGRGQMGFSWLVYTMMGSVIWFALLVPKGTIHIYDKSRNQYQPVTHIPDLIVIVAGITNTAYQGLYDLAFANSASTTRFSDEGMPIKVLMELMTGAGIGVDPYVSKSIAEMWKQCVPVAETRGFDANQLRTGSTTFNILSTISALRNPAVFTSWYSSSAPNGTTVSCTTAYANLQSVLGSPSTYDTRLRTICNKMGYQSSNATSYVYCKERIEESLQYVYGNTAISLSDAMGSIVVSQAIADALIQQNPDVAATMIANRSIVTSGMADANTNPEWLSTIMAGVIAIILSVTPLIVMIMVTPLVWSAFKLLIGMWVFITAWQTADAFLVQASTDEIITVLGEIKTMGFGLEAMQLAPSASQKAMSVLASARTQAVYVATLISGLLGVTAYGLNSFASRSIAQMDEATKRSENMFNDEGRGQQLEQMKTGLASQKAYAQIQDIDLMSRGAAFQEVAASHSANAQIDGLGGNMGHAATRTADVSAGNAIGNVVGTEQASLPGHSALQTASTHASVDAQSSIGQSRGMESVARSTGMSVSSQTELTSSVKTASDIGDSKGIFKAGDNDLKRVSNRQEEIASVRNAESYGDSRGKHTAFGDLDHVESATQYTSSTDAQQSLGRSQGINDAASSAGVSVTEQSRFNTGISTQAEVGHNRGTKDAADASGLSVIEQSRFNTEISTQVEVGHNRGTKDATEASGLSVVEQSRLNTGVKTASETGESKGILSAGNNELANVGSRQQTISGVRNSEVYGEAAGTESAFETLPGVQSASEFTAKESKSQHLADMQRQKDVVNTIVDERNVTESEARNDLSDASSAQVQATLAANNYSGDKVVDTATYDAKQHAAHQAGEREAYSELGVDPSDIANYSGERSGYDTQANNQITQKLSTALGGEQNRAQAESGANHHLAVNTEDAKRLQDAGLLSQEQAATVHDVSRVDLSMRADDAGNLHGTSSAHSGKSSSIDDSRMETDQSTINRGLDAGDAISQRNQLQSASGVRSLIDQSEIRSPGGYVNDLAMMGANSLSPFISVDHNKSTRHNNSVTGSVGVGFGIPGTKIGGDVQAVTSHGFESSDNVNVNAKAGIFRNELERLSKEGNSEAKKQHIEPTQKDDFVKDYVAERFSKFYQAEYKDATNKASETAPEPAQPKPSVFSTEPGPVERARERRMQRYERIQEHKLRQQEEASPGSVEPQPTGRGSNEAVDNTHSRPQHSVQTTPGSVE